MIIAVMPLCLGAFGSVRTVASPRWQIAASLVHTFWPVTTQPPSTRCGLGGDRRGVRARARLAEQLAPPQFALEAGPEQPLDLFGAAVLQQRRHHPFAQPEAGLVEARERVLDDQLLDRCRPPGHTASASAAAGNHYVPTASGGPSAAVSSSSARKSTRRLPVLLGLLGQSRRSCPGALP